MTLWLLLKHITESCLLLYDQHFHNLSQISPWTADSRHHFHSECVRLMFHEHPQHRCAHWAHLRDLWETLPLPSILYSRLNLLPSGCLPRITGKYCRGETSSLCFIQSVGRLAKKQPDTVHHLIHYSGLSIKALARVRQSFWQQTRKLLQPLFTLGSPG